MQRDAAVAQRVAEQAHTSTSEARVPNGQVPNRALVTAGEQRAQGLQAHDAESVARGAKLCERSVAAQRREKRHALGIAE